MKYVRRGLLMILILALVMPAPVVLAESETVVENTTDTTKLVDEEKDSSVMQKPQTGPVSTQEMPEQSLTGSSLFSDQTLTTTSDSQQASSIESSAVSSTESTSPTNPTIDTSTSNNEQISAAVVGVVISKISTTKDKKYVELYNSTDQIVNLHGWKLQYIAEGGKTTILKQFDINHEIAAHSLLVIGNVDKAAMLFDVKKPGLAMANGSVQLLRTGELTEDTIGWGKGAKKYEEGPTKGGVDILWRCFVGDAIVDSDNNVDDISSEQSDGENKPILPGEQASCPEKDDPDLSDPELPTPNPPGDTPPATTNKCKGLRLNEIFANTKNKEQFIEVRNSSETVLDLKGCQLVTDKHKATDFYEFGELELAAGDVLAVRASEMKLKLTKQAEGWVAVRDAAGEKIEEVKYEGLAEDTSWSLIDGKWLQTFTVTEDASNQYTKWRACEVGYFRNELTGRCNKIPVEIVPEPCGPGQFRNPETGRCKKIEVAKTPTPCKEGYYRSEETGRCRSIAAAAAKTLKPCADDEFRNPLTNRCKKIAADSDVLKDCPEGYERNPATNRCRKIRTASAPVVGFAPENVRQVAGATWGWWVLGGVSLLAVGYGTWQWRWEISRAVRKVAGIFASRGK